LDILARSHGVLRREEYIKKNENGADGDGGVGDVEGGVTVSAEPEFEKISDSAVNQAVGEIAGGSADEEREARESAPSDGLARNEEPGEGGDEEHREGGEEDATPGRWG